MEHHFFATNATRDEAQRWLSIAEKLLSTRDLMGSKSFASRARDSDPTLSQADQILAVADTLLAGDIRIGNNQHDWYSILGLTPSQGRDSEFVATQYRNLVLLLNPQQNKFAFVEEAFRLVIDAWSVLSNPSRKSMYDKELAYFAQQQQQPDPFGNPNPAMPLNFMLFGGNPASSGVSQHQVHAGTSSSGGPSHFEPAGGESTRIPQNYMNFASGSNIVFGSASNSNLNVEHANKSHETFSAFGDGNVSYSSGATQEQVNMNRQQQHQDNHNLNVGENVRDRRENDEDLERMDVPEEEGVDEPANDHGEPTFWTACPYCYHMYEYPSMYVDCCLKCQKCKMAFQGVVIPSPPPITAGQNNFCCWGFLPLGYSMENLEKNKSAVPAWTPFSPMFTSPQMGNMNTVNKRGGAHNSGPRVYFDDDEVFVELSDSDDSDDGDWRNIGKRNKRKANGKGSSGTPKKTRRISQVDKGKDVSVQDGSVPADNLVMLNKKTVEPSEKGPTTNNATGDPSKKDLTRNKSKTTGEPSKKGGASASTSARKQPVRGAKNFGKLDLNIECSNEGEELTIRMNPGNGPGRRDDENIEGIGFFEGLDEFLSSLPILNVVDDDKAVKA